MARYFESLETEAEACFSLAARARARGIDPSLEVEILPAEDMASRVERLLKDYDSAGVAARIREISRDHDREETALLVAQELAREPTRSKEQAIERAVRVGLAILTEGVVVAPLEGLAGVKVKRNRDGSTYLDLYYAGPIRSAGGTAQALSVLIADVVRRELGIGQYRAAREEVERFKEEIPFYKQLQHLQYTPTDEEIALVVSHVPVGINGEATEDEEISGYRDLPRIETNRVRGGACLVVAEGLCLKAPKVWKHVRKLGIDGWDFLEEYIVRRGRSQEEIEALGEGDEKFIQNIIAGRPVLAHPSRSGGFRLRYGRARCTGLAAVGLHPATMRIVDDFIAVGTQLKIERPGKAGVVTPVDSLEGPLVLLKNGDLVEVTSEAEALALRDQVQIITDLGEILIAYGEFLENNHALLPAAYAPEWYALELQRASGGGMPAGWDDPSAEEAIDWSRRYGVPLHPRYNLFWEDLSVEELQSLQAAIVSVGSWDGHGLLLPPDLGLKELLVRLGAPHKVVEGGVAVGRHSQVLLASLGILIEGKGLVMGARPEGAPDSLEFIKGASGLRVNPRGPTRIGARMGRPEKAKERRMQPPPHVLFPLGQEGGPQRLVSKALEAGDIEVEVGLRVCPSCGKRWFLSQCTCGGHTRATGRVGKMPIPLVEVFQRAQARAGPRGEAEIKGVQGMISRVKTPEALEKGILRAVHGVYVFKDGTVRFDMTNAPLTHFRPQEVGLSLERARELGYTKDHLGNPLEEAGQTLELRVQDFIPARVCGEYLLRISQFIDDLLVKVYGLEPYYRAETPEDLIGHLLLTLAPHTSVGVLARIVGYSEARVGYCHPFTIAARRRDADGDEDSVMLLLDSLVNFSRDFLPEKRGGLMDAPLVLTLSVDPREIDKEAHSLDVCPSYPLELYEAAARGLHPRQVEGLVDNVGKRLGTVLQYEGLDFTHPTGNVTAGPLSSAYVEGTMLEKLEAQLNLAMKIRAVDASDVVSRLVVHHFLPDLIGNLKAFASQQVRCTKCNTKYRRIPLKGECVECGGNLALTVSEGGVRKYLEVAKRISEEYAISPYLRQRLQLVEAAIDSLFTDEKVQPSKLEDFL